MHPRSRFKNSPLKHPPLIFLTLSSSALISLFGVGFGSVKHRIAGLATYPVYYCRTGTGMMVSGAQAANGACCNYSDNTPRSDQNPSPLPYNATLNPSPTAAPCINSSSDLTLALIEQSANTLSTFNRNLSNVNDLMSTTLTVSTVGGNRKLLISGTQGQTPLANHSSASSQGSGNQNSSAATATETSPFLDSSTSRVEQNSLKDLSNQLKAANAGGSIESGRGGSSGGGTSTQTAGNAREALPASATSLGDGETGGIASSGGGRGWGGAGGGDYLGSIGGGGAPSSASFGDQGDPNIKPMGNEDPEDYFTRIGIDENIFKIVERVYRRKAPNFLHHG
jgi:hypothetical protein